MTMPETKIRVGSLAYREFVVLGVSLRPLQMKVGLNKFYEYFKDYLSFPKKNLDHYPLMLRKLVKNQVIYYEQNKPLLTIKGKLLVEEVISSMPDKFQRKWEAYLELRSNLK